MGTQTINKESKMTNSLYPKTIRELFYELNERFDEVEFNIHNDLSSIQDEFRTSLYQLDLIIESFEELEGAGNNVWDEDTDSYIANKASEYEEDAEKELKKLNQELDSILKLSKLKVQEEDINDMLWEINNTIPLHIDSTNESIKNQLDEELGDLPLRISFLEMDLKPYRLFGVREMNLDDLSQQVISLHTETEQHYNARVGGHHNA